MGQTVTREQLYEQVWSVPMMRVAKDYGVSDVAIAKACKRLDVPRPWKGYWQQVDYGTAPERPPLPPQTSNVPGCTEIEPTPAKTQPTPFRFTARPFVSEIPADVDGCRPVVLATRAALLKATLSPDGRLRAKRAKGILKLAVTRGGIDRALCILEAVMRACEAQGWRIQTGDEEPKLTVFEGAGDVELRIIEGVKMGKMVRNPWMTREYTSTGVLRLEIESYCAPLRFRPWTDEGASPISQKLPEIIATIAHALACRRAFHAGWAKQQRQWDDKKRRHKEKEAASAAERARVGRLRSEAGKWRKAESIRTFCDEVERRAVAAGRLERAASWLTWARSIAAVIDPFESGYFDFLQ